MALFFSCTAQCDNLTIWCHFQIDMETSKAFLNINKDDICTWHFWIWLKSAEVHARNKKQSQNMLKLWMYFNNIQKGQNEHTQQESSTKYPEKVESNGILYKYNLHTLITTLNVIQHNLSQSRGKIVKHL